MAYYPPGTTNHAYWPSAQDNQMSRGNQSEPTTPNSPSSGSARFQTYGPPSSRSWGGFERLDSFEPSSGYERYQGAPERPMGYSKANRLPGGSTNSRDTALPPLRELVPNFDQLRNAPRGSRAPMISSATSSPGGEVARAAHPPSDYTHSPIQAKRRRLSSGDSAEQQRDSRVPRSYSRFPMPRREPSLDETKPGGGGSMRWSPPFFGQYPVPSQQRSPVGPWGDAAGGVTLPRLPGIGEHQGRSPPDPQRGGLEFHHPYDGDRHCLRGQQPLPLGAGQGYYDGRPLAHGSYGSYRDDGLDRKPRKRRGNLPKETTDFLYNWLQDHTSHAYPSEEEKQWMMRKTGLQLSKKMVPVSFPSRVANDRCFRPSLQLVHQRPTTEATDDDGECQGRGRCDGAVGRESARRTRSGPEP